MLIEGCQQELLVDGSENGIFYLIDENISKEICTFLGPWPEGIAREDCDIN
jgi:hypothetical protein